GLVGINDPLSLLATNYTQTGFRTNSSQPYKGSGRSLGCADFDGDGHEDVAAASVTGEFQIFFGDGTGTWTNSGLSWTLPTVPGVFPSRVHGIAAGDLNGDGLAEVWMGDIGAAPTALVIWNNVSR
ncbi:MAG: FG-GAP repeat domain-containing protein, partial [Planctomycetota bacterium]